MEGGQPGRAGSRSSVGAELVRVRMVVVKADMVAVRISEELGAIGKSTWRHREGTMRPSSLWTAGAAGWHRPGTPVVSRTSGQHRSLSGQRALGTWLGGSTPSCREPSGVAWEDGQFQEALRHHRARQDTPGQHVLPPPPPWTAGPAGGTVICPQGAGRHFPDPGRAPVSYGGCQLILLREGR